ncbi:hypothetical protein ALI144C_30895 [Actinosynnema sp. ALI-1.44]|uniref:mycothiol transferase n=1 Tax=Actinosynnema sp. ALI-1.44 TaxID=1933779 RepID=UPI00097C81E9|nr:DUF664 domain-containing protein [Actinosynnema sp. ALI-1.44]ONI77838.1 hypothetical protein ALI144C_30895 [Actinosynnema sp. ALI-1.44]
MSHNELRDLLDTLRGQRRHVLGILAGLSDADLRRPMLPSRWSCLGLVNHLALDVELFWFRAVVAGDPAAIAELAPLADAWQIDPDVPARRIVAGYSEQGELANAALVGISLDAAPAWWPVGQFGDWRLHTNREVLLHAITETACHAGHLDAARELLDGSQWFVLAERPSGLAVSGGRGGNG